MKSLVKNFISGLNLSEVIFDIILFLYTFVFLHSVGGNIHQSLGHWFFIFGGGIATFTIVWFFGIIIRNMHARTHNYIVLAVIIIACLWVAGSLVYTLIDHVIWLFNITEDGVIVLGNAFVIIYGFVTGIYMSITEIACDPGESAIVGRLQFFKVFGLGLLFFPFMALLAWLSNRVQESLIHPVILAVVGGGAYLFFFMTRLSDRMEARAEKQKLIESRPLQFFKAFILPFLIVSSMCLLEEIYVLGAVHHIQITGGKLDPGSLLIHLLITGIIPMRIILALHPPVYRKNLVMGIMSLSYFIYSVFIIVNELSGW